MVTVLVINAFGNSLALSIQIVHAVETTTSNKEWFI